MRWLILLSLLVGCTNPQINIYTTEKQEATHTAFYPDQTKFYPDKLAPNNCGTPTEPRECDYGSVTAYPDDYGSVTAYPKKAP